VTVNSTYATWDAIKGVSLGGRAKRVTDPAEITRMWAMMFKKFPQIGAQPPATGPELACFRVDRKVISLFDDTKGFGHMELLDVGPH